jgi:hypothetical protein
MWRPDESACHRRARRPKASAHEHVISNASIVLLITPALPGNCLTHCPRIEQVREPMSETMINRYLHEDDILAESLTRRAGSSASTRTEHHIQ